MRLLYSLAVYLLLPALFGYFVWRSLREPDYRRRWPERLGFIGRRAVGGLWLHAASVGEAQAALPLIERLLQRYPERPLVVTSFTPTGSALLRERFGDRIEHRYLPVDTPGAVARFLKRLQPRAGIIIETELWPNLLLACRQRAIPMVLASASLSERSARRYQLFPVKSLMRRALQAFEIVSVQSEADGARFSALGVYAGRLEINGNLKFDLQLARELPAQATTLRHDWNALGRPVWVAASTHEGEEQAAIDGFKALSKRFAKQLLILVPRHPQRFDGVAALLEQNGLRYSRRSRREKLGPEVQVLLVDTLGELMLFYAMADVAFVGGSLAPIGGHNLLEPAALGKAIVTGPHCESQQQLLDLLAAGGAVQTVADSAELQTVLAELLANPERCHAMGKAAAAVVAANKGALARVEGVIGRVILQRGIR